MNIYKISQEVNNEYDTYDSAIVIAKDEEEARRISPALYTNELYYDFSKENWGNWAFKVEEVMVEYIGKADKRFKESQVILSSFNAG